MVTNDDLKKILELNKADTVTDLCRQTIYLIEDMLYEIISEIDDGKITMNEIRDELQNIRTLLY